MPLVGPTRAAIRQAAVAALKGAATLAGDNVFDGRTWPVQIASLPALLVSTPIEAKEALPGMSVIPMFDTSVTLAVVVRTANQAPGKSISLGQAPQIEAALETLCSDIEDALLCTGAFSGLVQKVLSVHTQFTVTNDGAPVLGEASMVFVMQTHQEYEPDGGVPLTGIQAQMTTSGGAKAGLDITFPPPS